MDDWERMTDKELRAYINDIEQQVDEAEALWQRRKHEQREQTIAESLPYRAAAITHLEAHGYAITHTIIGSSTEGDWYQYCITHPFLEDGPCVPATLVRGWDVERLETLCAISVLGNLVSWHEHQSQQLAG